jgi:membrane-bound serine protease (ClpP class)
VNNILIDPNIVYLILIAALWLSVTAIYIPGTGVIEVLAVGGVIVSLALLAQLPTNWFAVMLLVVGVMGFLIMPLIEKRLALLSVAGLILQAVGSLTLFDGMAVSLPLVVGVVGVALVYHRFALLRVLEAHKQQPAMLDDEPIIGATGYVQKAIDPVGTVYVRGESWTARADAPLTAGTPITVVERDGLTLFVEAVKQKHQEPVEEI